MSRWADWLEYRLPVQAWYRRRFTEYQVPKNLNFWYVFGALSLFALATQIISGIWLMMYYVPTAEQAFHSIQHFERDIAYGWLIHDLHQLGASALFIVVFLHLLRSLLYQSYKAPREIVWWLGLLLWSFLMLEAFLGYVLPWGQMSYWAAQVLTALFSVFPGGEHWVELVRGDYQVSGVTLQRFFAFHVVVIPALIAWCVRAHIGALHRVGSSNPSGELPASANKKLTHISFHPYYTTKDLFAILIFLMIFLSVVFFKPSLGGLFSEPLNALPANLFQTPDNITTMWYLRPFYAMLRAIPDKTVGVSLVALAFVMLGALPWLDQEPLLGWKKRAVAIKILLMLWVLVIVGLGYVGGLHLTAETLLAGRILTGLYFVFFLLLPVLGKILSRKKIC